MTKVSVFWIGKRFYATAGITCLSACFLSSCGGGAGSQTGAELSPDLVAVTPVVPANEAALAASTPGLLLDYFKQKIKAGSVPLLSQGLPDGKFNVTTATALNATESPAAFAGTTLQERDVDENDWIKTDGTTLYGFTGSYFTNNGLNPGTLSLPQLQAERRLADGQLTPLARLSLSNELTYSGMYLVSGAKRLALVGQKYEYFYNSPIANPPVFAVSTVATPITASVASLSIAPAFTQSKVGIDLLNTLEVNASSSANLSVTHRIRLDGRLLGSRVVGDTLYLVSTWAPNLAKYAIPATATAAQADAVLANLNSLEILPKIQIDNSPAEPLVADTDCYVQAANASAGLEVTTVTAFNLASSSLQRSSRCFLGGNQAMYMSATAVYLASSRYLSGPVITLPNLFLPGNAKTDIHKFSLSGQTVSYRGSGEVAGNLGWEADKNAYRMSEFEGDLRVLTFTGENAWGSPIRPADQTTAQPAVSPATLTVLRETAGKLQTMGTLPSANRPAAIGKPGEQIYAVKFIGPRAYVVTFRRTDPLYVLDMSNPADPKTLGELEIPGYSDYLFPMGDSLLLGVGKDANDTGTVQGVKAALIDIADPAKPVVRGSVVLGKRGSASALDTSSRGINIFQQGNVFRVALPVRLNETPMRFAPTFFDPTTQSLARFEVDTQSKTLTSKPALVSVNYSASDNANGLYYGQYNLGQERSVQIGAFVYYFSGGKFLSQAW